MGSALVGFRLDAESRKKLDELAKAKHMRRAEALRDAVKEYLAIYLIAESPTVGTLHRRVQGIETRLTALEGLLMKKGVENTL